MVQVLDMPTAVLESTAESALATPAAEALPTAAELMTADEFEALYSGRPYELVDGVIEKVMPTTIPHGQVTRRAGTLLGNFVDVRQLGDVVGAETGFRLGSNIVRTPDVAFISTAKLATLANPDQFPLFAPDLAVEVVSSNDRANQLLRKVLMFLRAGTAMMWAIDPDLRCVYAYRADGTGQIFADGDMLDGGEVLPGLQIAVTDLFPALPPQPAAESADQPAIVVEPSAEQPDAAPTDQEADQQADQPSADQPSDPS